MAGLNQGVFVFAGNWAYSNLGCEAIVRGTSNILRAEVRDCRFISAYFTEEICRDEEREYDPSIIHQPLPFLKRYHPQWIKHQFEKRYFHRPTSAPVLRALRKSIKGVEAVFMLGGDTFSPDYGNADVYFDLSSLVVEAHIPVTIWGASIGPFKGDPVYERKVVEKLRKISLLCVRETETLAYLDGLGLKDNVVLSADPSYYLQPIPCKLSPDIETALQKGCIGINLSPLLHRFVIQDDPQQHSQGSFAKWTQIAAEIVRNIQRRFSRPVLLIPHVFSECGDIGRDDYLFLREVRKLLNDQEEVFLLNPGLNAGQTKYVISQLNAFAGARTHATLAAFSSGVPTICIGYSLKARGIAKDIYGNLDWLISGTDLVKDPSILGDRLVTLCDQDSSIRSHLEQVNPIFQQRARGGARRFLEIIG